MVFLLYLCNRFFRLALTDKIYFNLMHSIKKILAIGLGVTLFATCLMAEETKQKESLLPDYKQKIGFTYGVGADLCSNYIWRGLYVGGLSIQADANVGYGGLFLDMWWNLGANDWTFRGDGFNTNPLTSRTPGFNPEVDMTIGFSRWGLTLMFMHMYYFDTYRNADGTQGAPSRYFDFGNHPRGGLLGGGGGITQEWRIKYRVSDKLPLSILLCTRTWGRDGYMVDASGAYIPDAAYNALTLEGREACTLKRAYSTYIELGYDFYMPKNFSLEARVGMTPAKSMYTSMKGDFAVCNVSAKLNWYKDIAEHCRMTAFANLMINPWDMANNFIINGSQNPFLWNVGCGFYLK